jgi:hypothetical protein
VCNQETPDPLGGGVAVGVGVAVGFGVGVGVAVGVGLADGRTTEPLLVIVFEAVCKPRIGAKAFMQSIAPKINVQSRTIFFDFIISTYLLKLVAFLNQ